MIYTYRVICIESYRITFFRTAGSSVSIHPRAGISIFHSRAYRYAAYRTKLLYCTTTGTATGRAHGFERDIKSDVHAGFAPRFISSGHVPQLSKNKHKLLSENCRMKGRTAEAQMNKEFLLAGNMAEWLNKIDFTGISICAEEIDVTCDLSAPLSLRESHAQKLCASHQVIAAHDCTSLRADSVRP